MARKKEIRVVVNEGLEGEIRVFTTGLCGGDAGHGGKTSIGIYFESGDFKFTSNEKGFAITTAGDLELELLAALFSEATKLLEASKILG